MTIKAQLIGHHTFEIERVKARLANAKAPSTEASPAEWAAYLATAPDYIVKAHEQFVFHTSAVEYLVNV